MTDSNRLPVMPNGCTARSTSEHIDYFDVEFSPCDCEGETMPRCAISTIAVRQRLVIVRVLGGYET